MKDIFDKQDKYNECVVNRQNLVETLIGDPRIKVYLDQGAVYIKEVKKEIPLRKILNQIREEEILEIKNDLTKIKKNKFKKNSQHKDDFNIDDQIQGYVNPKKYISFAQFMKYFTTFRKNKDVSNTDLKFKRSKNDDQNEITAHDNLVDLLKIGFKSMEDKNGYVNVLQLLDKFRDNKNISNYMEIVVREPPKLSKDY